ncbi:hypothetical protein HYT53_00595 [Candidatus Woesearchaeota archaeon]|nr:hypothetical protein [Candidatus Woesearchaeota archaeon]
MDIDDFLERELSGIGLDTGKSGKPESPEHFRDIDASPLFENIRADLGKGNLELAEQSYVQLWHILAQQKLKWNKELYEQLLALSRQFSGMLSQAYGDVRKKASQIYELIGRGRNSLKEGKKDVPFRIYAEIEGLLNSMPNVFFEEKRAVQEQVMEFYKELKNTTDNELVRRVSSLVQEINMIIEKVNASIRANDMISAIVSYNKCMELYSQVPEGFLRHKNSAGMRLLEIYKSLSIYTEISSLQKQLSRQPARQQARQEAPGQQKQPIPSIPSQPATTQTLTKPMLVHTKKELAKRYIEKGFYNEAAKGIEEALQLDPGDAEARAIRAKIKTLQ